MKRLSIITGRSLQRIQRTPFRLFLPRCHDAKIVSFAAHVGEETIRCAISLEALQEHFQANLLKPLQSFICNRAAIEQISERLITQQRFEADGSVLIRSDDC